MRRYKCSVKLDDAWCHDGLTGSGKSLRLVNLSMREGKTFSRGDCWDCMSYGRNRYSVTSVLSHTNVVISGTCQVPKTRRAAQLMAAPY
jgi:hypothetical protein